MENPIVWNDYRFLIFDLDGTLIDSSTGVVKCTNFALAKFGDKSRSPEEIKKYIGYPLDDMFPVFSNAPVEKLKKAFHEMSREIMVPMAKSLPRAGEVLGYLYKKGYAMAIATTKYDQNTKGLIKKFGWSKYFKALVSGDEVKRVKPAPDLVQLALNRLNADAKQTVMIGDTVNDILAAHKVGVRTIIIRSPFGGHNVRPYNPELILNNISQLREIFRRI
jgi:HAD superfamily hydrolase (TIGR01509 family)